jgi:hypothetical protein
MLFHSKSRRNGDFFIRSSTVRDIYHRYFAKTGLPAQGRLRAITGQANAESTSRVPGAHHHCATELRECRQLGHPEWCFR